MSADGHPGFLVVDTRGLFCPVPIIKLSEAVDVVGGGGMIELVSDDPAIRFDLPAWCKSTGHEIVDRKREGIIFTYRVRVVGER